MKYKRLSYFVLTAILFLTGLSIYYASGLRFDYNFENFFPKGDPDLEYFLKYRDKFGYDNDYILIGIESEKSVFEPVFLKKVDSLTQFISKQRHVVQVSSPTTVSQPVIESFGVFNIPYLHVKEPDRYKQDSVLIFNTPELIGTLFSENGKAVSIVVQTTDNLMKLPSDTLISAVNNKMQELGLTNYHMAGKALAQSVFVDQMQEELVIFTGASLVLVTLVLFITFRSLFGVLVPLLVVVLSVVWSLGFMGLFGKPIDVLTVILPTIMFVVGMSDVVHIMAKYISETGAGTDKLLALKKTVKEVGVATFLTSV
ncbi:MAG: MMPL family transporter, partial [Hymenobacteraceae bacterium]|nr:MMPL family transporter [Hymenobacteraceae bacterium]MDX5397854.1 MMPL family transporter [Hymenobacteraceae bacterium]MDX5513926.1 MMPL family transporter [Hymenobacteraceae bacterium]